jgi:Uncharacterized protein conserved in bacteria
MRCPVCPDSTLVMSNREGIEIDYCPTCRGVWLDRGELDKIIDRSAREAAPQRDGRTEPPPYRPRDRDHDDRFRNDPYYYKHKRKGFLGELFDFD